MLYIVKKTKHCPCVSVSVSVRAAFFLLVQCDAITSEEEEVSCVVMLFFGGDDVGYSEKRSVMTDVNKYTFMIKDFRDSVIIAIITCDCNGLVKIWHGTIVNNTYYYWQ